MEKRATYGSTCHLVVDGADLWPDTPENRKLGLRVALDLTAQEASRFGWDLVKVKDIEAAEHNKQVTSSVTK